MRFALSPEQQDFATSLQDLLAKADLPTVIRSWGAGRHDAGLALWGRLGEMGVTALAVPEAYDGFGAGPVASSWPSKPWVATRFPARWWRPSPRCRRC